MNPSRSRASQRSLKARALQWLAQREQSRAELRRKLMPHAVAELAAAASAAAIGAASDAAIDAAIDAIERDVSPERDADAASCTAESAASRVDAVLDWLEAHKYLSNERFVESRVHARSSRFGNLRIRQELKQHQLNLPVETARALAATELQRAREVLERKFDQPPKEAAERMKQARFLAARGFSPETIGRALRGQGRHDVEPDPVDPRPD